MHWLHVNVSGGSRRCAYAASVPRRRCGRGWGWWASAEEIQVPKPERILEEVARELGFNLEELRRVTLRARQELSDSIRRFYYDTPEGKTIRLLLSIATRESGYADELRSWWTPEKREELRRIAKATNVGGIYSLLWGAGAWGRRPARHGRESRVTRIVFLLASVGAALTAALLLLSLLHAR